MWEFVIPMVLVAVYTCTLLPAALYAFIQRLVVIIMRSTLGTTITRYMLHAACLKLKLILLKFYHDIRVSYHTNESVFHALFGIRYESVWGPSRRRTAARHAICLRYRHICHCAFGLGQTYMAAQLYVTKLFLSFSLLSRIIVMLLRLLHCNTLLYSH